MECPLTGQLVSAIGQFEYIVRIIYPKFFELLAKKLALSQMQIY